MDGFALSVWGFVFPPKWKAPAVQGGTLALTFFGGALPPLLDYLIALDRHLREDY